MNYTDFRLISPAAQLDRWIQEHQAKFGTTPASVRMSIRDWDQIRRQVMASAPCVVQAMEMDAATSYMGVEVFTYVE